MSAEPAWCLFRVYPDTALEVKKAFNNAVKESEIPQKLQKYLEERESKPFITDQLFQINVNTYFPKALDNISDPSDLFTWEDINKTYDLFFGAFMRMLEVFLYKTTTYSAGEEPIIDFITSNRVGVSQFLYAGLGWKRAKKLPGYCGNIFISHKELRRTLVDIKSIFSEIGEEDFYARACLVGAGMEDNERCLENLYLLPLLLEKLLREGNGFLALNYPHIGSLSFPEDEDLV